MRIKILPSQAHQIACDIFAGRMPPETNDLEVLALLADYDGIEFYRMDGDVEKLIDAETLLDAIDDGVDLRP